jgi:hypothetical protein
LIISDFRPCIYDRCWIETTRKRANNTIKLVLFASRNVCCYNTLPCLWVSS